MLNNNSKWKLNIIRMKNFKNSSKDLLKGVNPQKIQKKIIKIQKMKQNDY